MSGVVSGLVGRLSRYARGAGLRARMEIAARRGQPIPGVVSLIVPVYNVEEYIDECLTSLRFQSYPLLDIVVVDDGSPDRSMEIVERHARRDPRVRIVRRENGGLSAARNSGLAAAAGEFITFVDSDDTLTVDGLKQAIDSLRATGSDFAVLRYQRINGSRITPPAGWIGKLHRNPQSSTSLVDRPDVLVNSMACSKVFRRVFWDRAGLRFKEGVIYEDQQLSAEAYAKAERFDILGATLYNWRLRRDGKSITQMRRLEDSAIASVEAQFNSIAATQQVLRTHSTEQVAVERAVQALSNDLPQFTARVPVYSESYWELLARRLPEVIDLLTGEQYSRRIPVHTKLINHYIRIGDRASAEQVIAAGWSPMANVRIHREAGELFAGFPGWEEARVDPVTRLNYLVPESQSKLYAGVRQVRAEGHWLTVSGWALVENLDLAGLDAAGSEHSVRVWLAGPSGQRIDLPVRTFTADWIEEVSLPGSWYPDYRPGGVEFRVDCTALTEGTWTIMAQVSAHGITRSREFIGRAPWSSVGVPVTVSVGGRDVSLAVKHAQRVKIGVTTAVAGGSTSVTAGQPPAWATATAAEVRDEALLVTLASQPPDGVSFALVGPHEEVPGTLREDRVLAFPLGRPRVDGMPGSLASGVFAVRARRPGQPDVPVAPDHELASAMPYDEVSELARTVIHSDHQDTAHVLAVDVLAPLLPHERGFRNRIRMQNLANAQQGDRPAVFFRTLYGEATNDSAGELHRVLHERGTDRELIWAVADRSVPVPEGGRAVLEQSEAWHVAMGSSSHMVVNIHQPNWFKSPSQQVVVQTFHGYPYKLMGQTLWSSRDMRASQVRSYLERSGDWDVLVSPSAYATPLLLREFFRPEDAARVKVVETGYPRNDVLFGERAASVRARTRAHLGIPDDAVAVLYAPTFRDHLSVDGKTAERSDFLDVDEFTRGLPDAYLLQRGHTFNARGRTDRVQGERVIDVTYYPDVMDLILASDAGILDYSSLRFDYALTRKPMVFLVPDRDQYHLWRPGLLNYSDTAPGPQVSTTAQVVGHLADLEGLRAGQAAQLERFLATYMECEDGHAAERVCDAIWGPEAKEGDGRL